MNEIIHLQDITTDRIATIFDNAAIDHEVNDDGQIYVTGHSFNFWVRFDERKALIIWWTYWDFVPDHDELEALRFINSLNLNKIMVQFAKGTENERFYGHYMLPVKEGLNPKTLLRVSQRFSSIVDECVQAGIAEGLLIPFDCGSDTCTETTTKH